MIENVNRVASSNLNAEEFTIGFARRATGYKRWELLFEDIERLKNIAARFGSIQVIFSGKAHPKDQTGKQAIQYILQMREILKQNMKIVFVENYTMDVAKLLVSGVDVWLNTPKPPLEASGTSGMKAAINGVPSLSILDGWWLEGHIEGVTGWAIGEKHLGDQETQNNANDAHSLYDKLENVILPLFYHDHKKFTTVMKHAIAINGSFFNAQRMVQQYVMNAYYH